MCGCWDLSWSVFSIVAVRGLETRVDAILCCCVSWACNREFFESLSFNSFLTFRDDARVVLLLDMSRFVSRSLACSLLWVCCCVFVSVLHNTAKMSGFFLSLCSFCAGLADQDHDPRRRPGHQRLLHADLHSAARTILARRR